MWRGSTSISERIPLLYDAIGAGYNTTRRADPYITSRILHHLQPRASGRYLDIGCGTGNYLSQLIAHDIACIGVDPSATMLGAARAQCPDAVLVQAMAEDLPLRRRTFDGAIGILTTHHWSQLGIGLVELARVLKRDAKLVLFTFTPQQLLSYWLTTYFPSMMHHAAAGIPDLTSLLRTIERAGFEVVATEPYSVRDDLQDHFLYAYKHDPAQYLRPEVRAGMSGFRLLATPHELTEGLARLEADIASGAIFDVIARADRESSDAGDYLFVSSRAAADTSRV